MDGGHDGRHGRLSSLLALGVLGASVATASRETRAPRADTVPGDDDAQAGGEAAQRGGILGRIDALQQRWRPVAFVVAVIKKFGDDRAGHGAALIAYYGFFSLFPAMLALVTITGFVLEDRPELRDDIENSALGQFPVIGDSLAGATGQPLSGHGVALAIGLFGALWAGMGAMQAAQDAMNNVWDVPRQRYPNFLWKRLRSLLMLGLVGGLLIGGAVLSQIATALGGLGDIARAFLIVGSVALDIVVFWVAFRVLTVADVRWRRLLPGAVVAGMAYYALQLLGQWYITRVVKGAEDTYGTFAVVIGLLSWMYAQGQIVMYAAEINVVAARRLWPRSLFGPPSTAADRASVSAQARAEQMHESAQVDVSFRQPQRS